MLSAREGCKEGAVRNERRQGAATRREARVGQEGQVERRREGRGGGKERKGYSCLVGRPGLPSERVSWMSAGRESLAELS